MSTIDLWKIYKTVYARFHYVMSAGTKSDETRCRATKMEAAALKIIEAAEKNEDMPAMLRLITQLEKAETTYGNSPDVRGGNPRASELFEEAVRSGNYMIGRPHQISKKPERGTVYCARAAFGTRKGQLKIGHTTLLLKKRLQLYRSKYGYEMTPIFSMEVEKPTEIEREVQSRLKPYRISGSTNGDSNEWYRIDAARAMRTIKSAIRKSGLRRFGEVNHGNSVK